MSEAGEGNIAYGEANMVVLSLRRSCNSRIVISAMGRRLGRTEGRKPGGTCCLH